MSVFFTRLFSAFRLEIARTRKNVGSRLHVWIARHRVAIRSLAWLGLSVIAFALATYFTRKIAYTAHVMDAEARPGTILTENSAWYVFTVFAAPGTTGIAEVSYDRGIAGIEEAVLSFKLPPGTQKLRIWHIYGAYGCHYLGPDQPFPGKSLPASMDLADNAIVDVSGLALDGDHEVDCDLNMRELRETFTATVSLFYNLPNVPVWSNQGAKLVPIATKLRFNSRFGNVEVASAPAGSTEGSVILQPNQNAMIRFRSIRDEQDRDWYLVLIGAFVAFGAALILEALRPFIERIGQGADSPGE
jgi:hypothetical protein